LEPVDSKLVKSFNQQSAKTEQKKEAVLSHTTPSKKSERQLERYKFDDSAASVTEQSAALEDAVNSAKVAAFDQFADKKKSTYNFDIYSTKIDHDSLTIAQY